MASPIVPSPKSMLKPNTSVEDDISSVDALLDTFSKAAERSLAAAEEAAEAERKAAAAAEAAAEAYLAAAAAVGTAAFARLKEVAEAAEKNTEALSDAAAVAYTDYFAACAQSMDASAALDKAEAEEEKQEAANQAKSKPA